MPDFKDLKDLEKYLQSKINDSLNNEVADMVKDEIVTSVNDVVYSAGIPKRYERRGIFPNSLGLGDEMQMHHTVKDGVLEVTDDASINLDPRYHESDIDMSKSLAENIEYGYGSKKLWYNEPRPFMKDAENNIKSKKSHIKTMKEGLKKRGLNVES